MLNSDLNLPLKPQSIDFVIDSFSFNQYSLLNNDSPATLLKPYLKQDSKIIGSYLFYHASAISLKNIQSRYPNAHHKAYCSDYHIEYLKNDGIRMTKNEQIGFIEDPGVFFHYHAEREKMHLYAYTADFGDTHTA